MNEKKTDNRRSFHLAIGLILAAAAALLLGAGRLGDSMITRQAEQEAAQTEWRTAAERLIQHQEKDRRQENDLRTLAMRHPEYLLQALHTGMHPETEN